MELFPNSRVLLSLGGLHITWYAVLILTGVVIAYLLAQRSMKKWGYSASVLEDYVSSFKEDDIKYFYKVIIM